MKNTLFALLLSFSVIIGYGQATIPVSQLAISGTALPTGFTRNIIGTYGGNYSNPVNPSFRLDDAGEFLVVNYNSSAIYANFTLKGNPGTGAWSGAFTILESVNGITYSTVRTINSILSVNAGEYFSVVLNPNSRFLKFNFTTKTNGNVALCKINISNSIPLPVELSMFRGEEQYLLWTTQSETQNKGWEIERSSDAKTWSNIGFVEGFGNSSQKLDYHFELKEFGKYYYRLKQIDFDGHFEYSEITFLDNSDIKSESKMYIDLNGRETTKPKANTMYIIPDGRKIMYIEK
jgi:hypothetical protein